jgi:[ribosomal protein S18]-alanine N-acetyltransferase
MDSAEIVLRDYRETDLEAMCLLDAVCFAEEFAFDFETIRAFASARNSIAVAAETTRGVMVGFLIAQMERTVAGRRGYIVTLDVSPEWRRMGLGAHLMSEVERRAMEAGARWMDLHVFTGNIAAIGFYERLGYVRGTLRLGFYGSEGLDAFAYRKELIAL